MRGRKSEILRKLNNFSFYYPNKNSELSEGASVFMFIYLKMFSLEYIVV